jgi:aminoglycoside phosphotransferase (APT) family kinase protein
MAETSSLFMRAIGEELSERIIPELRTADAIERANFARLVLQNLAADIDVLPGVAAELVPAFRATIAEALNELPASAFGDRIPEWRAALQAIQAEQGLARQREVAALRSLGAVIARQSADVVRERSARQGQSKIEAVLARLGSIDHQWLTTYDSAIKRPVGAAAASSNEPTTRSATGPSPTVATVTAYLRRAFPQSPQIAATEVVSIPGGRSKKTFFITINGTDALPADAVIRQDYALKYEGTKVRDEYQPLAKLSAMGLPVPRPLHLEAAESEIGPPFMLVERLKGTAPGSYFGLKTPCPGAFRDLARMLASLHRTPPAELGFADRITATNSLESLIDQYELKWRTNATKPSPLVDYAYAWARHEARRDPGRIVVVHGDSGPYNFLVDADRLTAVLDWEFAHLGDPAEDLGIARVYAEDVMEWREFLDIYATAGGPEVPEHRVRLAMVLQFLKGTTLVAASGRNFEEGWTREFIKGANAFTGLRLIELKIATLLQRFQGL